MKTNTKTKGTSAPIKRVGLTVHPMQDRAQDAVERLKKAAESNGIGIIELGHDPENSCSADSKSCEAVVSIGGDGTLLAAVRWAYPSNVPVWGINVGDLGYLTTSGTDDIEELTGKLSRGEYWVEDRTMVEGIVNGGSKRLLALNDIVVHRHVPGGGLMMLDVQLNGRFLATYEADGLIISTPTGSTGYNMSAGGSILSPDLKAFILTPICAHSFSARSLVVDDSSELIVRPRLKYENEVAFATADGQEIAELVNCPTRDDDKAKEFCTNCEVVVKRGERPAGLIRFDEVFFSDVLRDKLSWAESAPKRFK